MKISNHIRTLFLLVAFATKTELVCCFIPETSLCWRTWNSGEKNQNAQDQRHQILSPQRHTERARFFLFSSSNGNENGFYYGENNSVDPVQDMQISRQREALVKAKLKISESLVSLELLGKGSLPTTAGSNRNQTCFVLTAEGVTNGSDGLSNPLPALMVPLDNDNQIRLIEASYAKQDLTPPVLLRLNALAVNRDEGLFDNIPWSIWTIDPLGRNRDAAGNPIDAKFHFGKRDAYNVMLGKDWGRSFVQQIRNNVDQKEEKDAETESEDVLMRRLLELQLREARMDLAECDYQIAIAKTMDESWALEDERAILASRVASMEEQMQQIKDQESSSNGIVDRVLENLETRRDVAPYRGATGYSPKREAMDDRPYTSPYDMFKTILKDQLKAEVIGALLENTSLLEGTTVLGGVLVLRRITARKSTVIAGEALSVSDKYEDYGNDGILGGETFVVECDVDEAFGMSLACGVPLQVEQSIWENSSLMVQATNIDQSSRKLNKWESVDPRVSFLVEGQAGNQSATERVAPLRSPRSTGSLFDAVVNPPETDSTDLFPTDNPIQSIKQLDNLSNEDKARTLLSLSNFEGRLPRPRALRESEESGEKMNALDRLLLPLIDEGVRREFYIRQAIENGDFELAQELESSKSMRQIAKEKAQRAEEAGEPEVSDYWKKEVELYSSLRADVTQDEGSYSRFLDRDEWYERERRKSAARVDRKKFGNLLDGIE